jgi:hypothetical protein
LPVVPVWLAGNDDLRVWSLRGPARVVVRFGEPIRPDFPSPGELVDRIEAAFDRLAAGPGRLP